MRLDEACEVWGLPPRNGYEEITRGNFWVFCRMPDDAMIYLRLSSPYHVLVLDSVWPRFHQVRALVGENTWSVTPELAGRDWEHVGYYLPHEGMIVPKNWYDNAINSLRT